MIKASNSTSILFDCSVPFRESPTFVGIEIAADVPDFNTIDLTIDAQSQDIRAAQFQLTVMEGSAIVQSLEAVGPAAEANFIAFQPNSGSSLPIVQIFQVSRTLVGRERDGVD